MVANISWTMEPQLSEDDYGTTVDEDEDSHVDPADVMLQRGAFLRKLRDLEREDELARQQEQESDGADDSGGNQLTLPQGVNDTSPVSDFILDYNSYLSHQTFYDDLKHVDYKFIDYGEIQNGTTKKDHNFDAPSRNTLVVEQDKSLGKGGLCWDAAFCLGEHLVATQNEWISLVAKKDAPEGGESMVSVIELGSGTGLCGLMVAKGCAGICVSLTDLPSLMPILNRNICRNFQKNKIVLHKNGPTFETKLATDKEYTLQSLVHEKSSNGNVSSFSLDWDDVVGDASASSTDEHSVTDTIAELSFDVVIGADVVATLYDPVALAKTIHQVAKDERSVVYISFKERLSSIHRSFEQALGELFDSIEIILASSQNSEIHSRNRNPDVGILIARGKKIKG